MLLKIIKTYEDDRLSFTLRNFNLGGEDVGDAARFWYPPVEEPTFLVPRSQTQRPSLPLVGPRVLASQLRSDQREAARGVFV